MNLDLSWILLGLPVAFVLGWVASRLDLRQLRIENRRNPKAYFHAAPAAQPEAEDWLEAAGERQQGSWWPHWRQWIGQRSGASRSAPKTLGSKKYPALCAAPGTYVLER